MKASRPQTTAFLYFSVFLLALLGSCGSDFFGDDMTEEEYLANCKAAIETAPEVTEFYYENEDNRLETFRNEGFSSLLVKKKENVWRVIVTTSFDAEPEAFTEPDLFRSYMDTLFLDASSLFVNNSDPENEYWMIDIRFPATNLGITYEVFYQCEDGLLSDPAVFELQTPDICVIHPLWELRSASAQLTGPTSTKDQKILEWKGQLLPGDSDAMPFLSYERISSKAYISSGSYTYVYEDFLETYRVPDYPEQNLTLSEYISSFSLQIDLHELTGISEEEWQNWNEPVTIEGEIQFCGENFMMYSYYNETRFHITTWNPY